VSKKFTRCSRSDSIIGTGKSIDKIRSIKLLVPDEIESVRRMFRAKLRCSGIMVQPLVDFTENCFQFVRWRTLNVWSRKSQTKTTARH
jgi:hypothetical protein